jgi:hypothetical protein
MEDHETFVSTAKMMTQVYAKPNEPQKAIILARK